MINRRENKFWLYLINQVNVNNKKVIFNMVQSLKSLKAGINTQIKAPYKNNIHKSFSYFSYFYFLIIEELMELFVQVLVLVVQLFLYVIRQLIKEYLNDVCYNNCCLCDLLEIRNEMFISWKCEYSNCFLVNKKNSKNL